MKQYKLQGTDINSTISYIAGHIVLRGAEDVEAKSWDKLRGYSAQIKGLESLMYSYVYTDKNYLEQRSRILLKLKSRKTLTHEAYFESWNKIFGMLTTKMHALGIYPRGNIAMMAGGKKIWSLTEERSIIEDVELDGSNE